jgi:uncharacterized protein YndB with AHSA1/START domain
MCRMASIRRETTIAASPEQVWDAVRDFGALHERLVPGFVVDTEMDGGDRIVTFFNGAKVREVLIDSDDEARRLVWSIVDGPYTHHNGAIDVLAGDDGGSVFVWTSDLLPDAAAETTAQMMERGSAVAKQTLET